MKKSIIAVTLILPLVALLALSPILSEQVFAMHGNPSHHEQMQHHKQQAMQHDENCRMGQDCDHMQASEHHSQTAMNCHEIGDYECSSMHYTESARHHKEMNDMKNYAKYHAHSLHEKGVMKHGNSYVLPPHHQMHIVDSPDDIQCRQGFEKIFKSRTDQPHCVSPDTADRLTNSGWGRR